LLGEVTEVKEGGYSLRAPLGYDTQIKGAQVVAHSSDKNIFLTLLGWNSATETRTQMQVAETYMDALFQSGSGKYKLGGESSDPVEKVKWSRFDYTGTIYGAAVQGEGYIVNNEDGQYVFALSFAKTSQNKNAWTQSGAPVFSAVIGSLKFLASD
jgi:hypothetical protein